MKASPAPRDGLTPLMRQYYKIKEKYPDKILFFRMGDFYEVFGDDAVAAAPILNIALTTRGKINGEKIPLAGVPHHSADKYLARLLQAGRKVVVVEQVEDPRLAKGVVKREVVEILTPGTATVESAVEETSRTYLAAVYAAAGRVGLAYIELSTGKFHLDEGEPDKILETLRILAPREVLYPREDKVPDFIENLLKSEIFPLTPFEAWNFDAKTARRELCEFFGVTTLDGFGIGRYRQGLAAAGSIYRYLLENHRTRLDHVRKLTASESESYMALDYGTIRNLELVRNLAENTEQNSFLAAINRTVTPGGARRLRDCLLHPYREKEPIIRRQRAVRELYEHHEQALDLAVPLKKIPDLERLAGRLGMRKINPRQLAAISGGLEIGRQVLAHVENLHAPLFKNIAGTYPDCGHIIETISLALVEEPPLVVNKGNIFRRGFAERLDELKDSIKDARDYIARLQTVERERTGIPSLKVGFNKVFGYYIEVTKTHLDKVPEAYIRKQTLVNAERFITEELKVKEDLIMAAEEKIFSLEEELFRDLVEEVAGALEDILAVAEIICEIDLVTGLAVLAFEKMYRCPEILEDTTLEIAAGRHAVIEDILPPGSFIANDVDLNTDGNRIMILTGPNMSGKSTYLRQIGLIVILAQIGSFVPADMARIGLVDRVFTRVGAIDNLARGQSTFLVEMIETSNILHNATDRSLILLDEVGRGTSTFDGMSIAWAVVEHINENIRARTVFATHYHELTGLAALYERITNYQVAVKRWEDRIVFLHKIIPGGCDDSYGIEVARLAGIPRTTLGRARELLKLLESGRFSQSELARGIHREILQRSLFDTAPSAVEEDLKKIDLDRVSPMEALRILNELKKKLED